MPFPSGKYWLDTEKRKTARAVDEDGEPSDDEEPVNFQSRTERTSAGTSASALPRARLRGN